MIARAIRNYPAPVSRPWATRSVPEAASIALVREAGPQ
jgi:hypothetical protein